MLLSTVSFVMVTLLSSQCIALDPALRAAYRIIGGTPVEESMPWIVYLLPDSGGGGCTGSLLNSQHILTAAHCVLQRHDNHNCTEPLLKRPKSMTVVIGEISFNDTWQEHHVNNYWTHPVFDHWCNDWDMDFAVLKLAKPVNNSQVCLGSYKDGPLYAIGYGQTDHDINSGMSSQLMSVEVSYVSPSECTDKWGYTINKNHLCTEGKKGAHGTCRGDSGGPLSYYSNSTGHIQIGVTSYGSDQDKKACDKLFPDVYGLVAAGLPWIKSKAGDVKTC